jgi:hypothetical protein
MRPPPAHAAACVLRALLRCCCMACGCWLPAGCLLPAQSTGQCLQRPLIAFDAWLLALGR